MLGHSKKFQVWPGGPWGSLEATLTPGQAPGSSWDPAPRSSEGAPMPTPARSAPTFPNKILWGSSAVLRGDLGAGQGSQL